ncbi:hypothetical protein [Bdellovibrio bacteriovorus]|uniref:hypothetical protein n=1 Tax=Bdellovibrio bacteriovorus TaxID=959 RepID=UPI0035A92450
MSACSQKDSEPALKSIGGSPDFFQVTTETLPSEESSWVRPTDCRGNIAKVLCEVDPSDDWSRVLERPCLGGEEKYRPAIEEIYDSMDDFNKGMFCSLRRIFIERDFYATGYASSVYARDEEGNGIRLPGAIMGVRKSVLETQPSFGGWATWKEQMNFAKVENEFQAPLPYPQLKTAKATPLLQYVFVHEFGHLFDYANKLNKEELGDPTCFDRDIDTDEAYYRECKPYMAPNSWGDISWKDFLTVKPEKDFSFRSKLCFYNCESYIDVNTEMVLLYKGLSQSDFVTSYAASNHMDDFAESWAVRWLVESQQGGLSVQASPELEVRAEDIYNSEKFKTKRDFIEAFTKNPVLYP